MISPAHRFQFVAGPKRAADSALGKVREVLREVDPPCPVVIPEMVAWVYLADADGKPGGRKGRIVFGSVDHVRRWLRGTHHEQPAS